MKAHTKAATRRLERILATLQNEAENAKTYWESEKQALTFAQVERNSGSNAQRACYKLPVALVRKIESLAQRIEHAEWLWEKACSARNAVRDLVTGGKIEL